MLTSDQKKRLTPPVSVDKELEFPDTIFIRDIENKVFQGIVLQCLANIPDITLLEGGFIDNIFSRGSVEGIKGITTEQDNKAQSISVKIEVNVNYGICIPDKAEEIQSKVAEQITLLTGLHVACVHVVFKNITPFNTLKKSLPIKSEPEQPAPPTPSEEVIIEKAYAEEWQ